MHSLLHLSEPAEWVTQDSIELFLETECAIPDERNPYTPATQLVGMASHEQIRSYSHFVSSRIPWQKLELKFAALAENERSEERCVFHN